MIGAMNQTVLDQCVFVAAQWGVVASFIPLALSRLIPHAIQSRRGYLNTGADADRRRAVWAVWYILGAAFVGLAALALLSWLGLADVARASPTPGKWLGASVVLLMPVLVHVGFLALGFGGVRSVPLLAMLRLRLAPIKYRPPSPAGNRSPTVVRFLNTRAWDVYVWVLSGNGTIGGAGTRLRPGDERAVNTSAGHHFVIRDRDGDLDNLDADLALVTAAATPGLATIE